MLQPIRDINQSYLKHLAERQDDSLRQLEQLNRFLIESNCTFRGEPMPFFLKPNFISAKQSALLTRAVEKMSRILQKFIRFYLVDREAREIMRFTDIENELFFIDPGYENPLVISRLDAFLDDYSIKFLEFNCDSPAGIAYSDVMEEGFERLFKDYSFMSQWKVSSLQRQDRLLASLLECYRQFRSGSSRLPENPVIAIIDWKDVSTYSEFELHQQHFRNNGCETLIASPQDLRIRNGKAMIGDQEVNLVYRRVITRELVEKLDETRDFIRAVSEGLVCCCNSFRSYIVGNKKVLSLISDRKFQDIFTADEVRFIEETIPWTQVLADSRVDYGGSMVSLKEFTLENREKLVLKPANMYGGKDVNIGKETDPSTWEEIMLEHIDDESWVVQEYVDIPRDTYPEIGPSVKLKDKYVNINPFALSGKYSGTITRVSDHAVINVSAGGGLVPTFTARKA